MDSRRNFSRCGRPMNVPVNMQSRNFGSGMISANCAAPDGRMMNQSGMQTITAYSLAMVYAPKQSFDMLYDLQSALCNGTIFKELNMPFAPGRRC